MVEGLLDETSLIDATDGNLLEVETLRGSYLYLLQLAKGNRYYETIVNNMEAALGGYVTEKQVTTKQMLFRAISTQKEVRGMETTGQVFSKTMIDNPKPDYWAINGPKLNPISKDPKMKNVILLMRKIALCQSYKPRSQFVSVGLDFETARNFAADEKDIYAFELIPQCELMGFSESKLKFSYETQFQVFGGTKMDSLYNYAGKTSEGKALWRQYDFNKKQWGSAVVMDLENYEYELLKQRYGEKE